MTMPDLQRFHEVSRSLDYRSPLCALLSQFRDGRIAENADGGEGAVIHRHLAGLQRAWDDVFPPFPATPWRRRTLAMEYHRGRRDVYLRQILHSSLAHGNDHPRLVVNPAAVFGRHARRLAHGLPGFQIIGTDIDGRWNEMFRPLGFLKYGRLKNYTFVKENVFEPDLGRRPAAVTWFGACGVVTDGCIDYGLAVEAPLVVFRACCHDNIAGNTEIVRRPSPINKFFAFKNRQFVSIRNKASWGGFYFSERYLADAYPRSRAAREFVDSETIIEVARNSVDSDICRSIIDLDRCLYLQECGYDVMYRDELFFACRRP